MKSIKKKNVLYKRFLIMPTPSRKKRFKCFRNKLNHLLRLAKREFYEKKLTEYKCNVKHTWRILNEAINNRKNKTNRLPSTFKLADAEINDPVKIAQGFCDYFTGIGPSLAAKVPTSNKSFTCFLGNDLINSVLFEETNHREIIDICENLRPGAAAGYDKMFMWTL